MKMMSNGLLSGSIVFSILSFMSSLLIIYPPTSLWLVDRAELLDDFCWHGEGFVISDAVWGNDLPGTHIKCPNDKHGVNSVDFYCDSSKNDGDHSESDTFNDEMCSLIPYIRFIIGFSLMMNALSILSGMAILSRYLTMLGISYVSGFASFVSLLAMIVHISSIISVSNSALFSQKHLEYVGRDNAVNFHDGFGCVFQSPFADIKNIMNSVPMRCVYPGPAFMLAMSGVVCSFTAAVMYSLYYFNTSKIILHMDIHLSQDTQSSLTNDRLDTNILETNQSSALTTKHKIHVPKSFQASRTYSLYGAFTRRIDSFPIWERHLLAMILPLILLGNGLLFAWWSVYGLQIVTDVHVGESIASKIANQHVLSNLRIFNNEERHIQLSNQTNMQDLDENGAFMSMTEQVYNFDPITSVKQFWESDAHYVAMIAGIWLDFFPFLKVLLWVICWFTPMNEVSRGRLLSWLDAFGKWGLSTLFCMGIMMSIFFFDRYISIPLPSVITKNKPFMIHIKVRCVGKAGSSWLIIAIVWSMLLGNLMVEIHSRAVIWEEKRKNKEMPDEPSHKKTSLNNIADINNVNNINNINSDSRRSSASFMERDTCVDNRITFGIIDEHLDIQEHTQSHLEGAAEYKVLDPWSASSSPTVQLLNNMEQKSLTGSEGNDKNDDNDDDDNQSSSTVSHSDSIFFLRRNSSMLFDRIVGNHRQFIDEKESLSNRYFSPIHHNQHRFTKRGKMLMLFSFFVHLFITIAAIVSSCGRFKREGVVGSYLISKGDQMIEPSPALFGKYMDDIGLGDIGTCIFLLCLVIPILHLFGLMVMWFVDMTILVQERWFRIIEFMQTWSALDVFALSLLVTVSDVRDISLRIVGVVVPGMDKAAKEIFPEKEGLYVVDAKFLFGAFILVIAVIGEWILTSLSLQLAAIALAERKVKSQYMIAKRTHRSTSSNQQGQRNEDNSSRQHIIRSNSSSLLMSPNSITEITNQQENNDAVEDLLQHNNLDHFSPAARYLSVSAAPTDYIYAGVPRYLWRLGLKCGLLEEQSRNEQER